ncbi:MAG: LysM peptidoglycan-binding domain-containing protein [Anaerolineales bacterium]|nr:LysM peptidoglycan-binding domain-containing protein [Anaerolineales bacterium]
MKVNRSFVFLIAALLVVGLAACERSIPGSKEATPVPVEQTQEATPAQAEVIEQIYLFATQTAMAQAGALPAATEVPYPQPTQSAKPTKQAKPSQKPTKSAPKPTAVKPADIPPITVPASYTLKGGEFPYCIARRFDVDPGELLRLNGLATYSVYYTGMTLRIPQSGRAFPGNRALRPHPATYIVRAGDTIYKIACAFGDVDPDAIIAANSLPKPYTLTPGQKLTIP